MARVFLSHSSRDKSFVTRLAEDLGRRGHEPWLDSWNIKVGDCIVQEVARGIADADFVVIVLSPHSVQSGWVEREWHAKFWDEIEHRRVMVLPILIEDCRIPTLLKTRRYADCRGELYATGFADLAIALGPAQIQRPKPEVDEAITRAKDPRISTLITKIHGRKLPLAACVAEALEIATSIGDRDLGGISQRELAGYEGRKGDESTVAKKINENAAHRCLETYVSLEAEINTEYFGWNGDLSNAIAMMAKDPQFHRISLLYPTALSQLEQEAVGRSSAKGMLHFTVPAHVLVPSTKAKDWKVKCYARGDALVDMLERIRTLLTSHLLRLMPTASAS